MAKPKRIQESVRVSLVISKRQLERVQHMAIRMSSQEGRQITPSEAIRMAIEAAYPIPKDQQATLF